MPLPKNVTTVLEKNKVAYQVEEHKTTFTALDTVATQGLEKSEVVKTLVMKAGSNKYFFACVPAGKNLDKKKLKKIFNAYLKKQGEKPVSEVGFAKEKWMKENLSGNVGSTPPFPSLFLKKWGSLPVFFDNGLTKAKKLYFNSGDYQKSLVLSPSKYMKLESVVKGSFSQIKK